MERQIGAFNPSVPACLLSLDLLLANLHHAVMKAFKGTINLKLLHPLAVVVTSISASQNG
jgi:hypothetical protein